MRNPDSPDYPQAHLSQDLLIKMQSQTRNILDAVERITIEDEVDRKKVAEAAVFIESPTENLSDIMSHTTPIGQVLGGYAMQGVEPPSEIDAMHGYLVALQCINRINFIEEELAQGSPDISGVQQAMINVSDCARTLSKGYNDNTFLDALNELRDRLGNL